MSKLTPEQISQLQARGYTVSSVVGPTEARVLSRQLEGAEIFGEPGEHAAIVRVLLAIAAEADGVQPHHSSVKREQRRDGHKRSRKNGHDVGHHGHKH